MGCAPGVRITWKLRLGRGEGDAELESCVRGDSPPRPCRALAGRSSLCHAALPVPPAPAVPPAPHHGHPAWRCVRCLGNPSDGNRLPSGATPARRDGRCTRLGLQAQRGPCDYFGAALRDTAQGCQEAWRGLPGHPPELCEECPCARVAARQALPRHIPAARAASSTGDYRSGARERGRSGAVGRAAPGVSIIPVTVPGEGPGASQLLGRTGHSRGWGTGVLWAEHPQPPTARGVHCMLPCGAACRSPAQHPHQT